MIYGYKLSIYWLDFVLLSNAEVNNEKLINSTFVEQFHCCLYKNLHLLQFYFKYFSNEHWGKLWEVYNRRNCIEFFNKMLALWGGNDLIWKIFVR